MTLSRPNFGVAAAESAARVVLAIVSSLLYASYK